MIEMVAGSKTTPSSRQGMRQTVRRAVRMAASSRPPDGQSSAALAGRPQLLLRSTCVGAPRPSGSKRSTCSEAERHSRKRSIPQRWSMPSKRTRCSRSRSEQALAVGCGYVPDRLSSRVIPSAHRAWGRRATSCEHTSAERLGQVRRWPCGPAEASLSASIATSLPTSRRKRKQSPTVRAALVMRTGTPSKVSVHDTVALSRRRRSRTTRSASPGRRGVRSLCGMAIHSLPRKRRGEPVDAQGREQADDGGRDTCADGGQAVVLGRFICRHAVEAARPRARQSRHPPAVVAPGSRRPLRQRRTGGRSSARRGRCSTRSRRVRHAGWT